MSSFDSSQNGFSLAPSLAPFLCLPLFLLVSIVDTSNSDQIAAREGHRIHRKKHNHQLHVT